jgi:hypothetical protein
MLSNLSSRHREAGPFWRSFRWAVRLSDSRSIWSPDTGSARQTGIRLIDVLLGERRWGVLLLALFAGNIVVATVAWFLVSLLME